MSSTHTRSVFAALTATLALAGVAGAQVESRIRVEPRGFAYITGADGDRAVIGVMTSTGSARDTLGVLVSAVTPGGPADKAGIEEGSRIAAVNGVNLRLSPADVGDWDMSSAMSRRLTRELGKVKAGDEVELRVYGGGQARTVRVKTVSADALNRAMWRGRDGDDRAVLGVSLGSGSRRDTLGVLIMGLDDDGPAAKAGLEEGNRIQSINGVDLRVGREDAGDTYISSAMVRRLQREMEKVKAGDEVTLRVYQGGGRTREIRVKTAALSDLPRRRSSISIFGTTPMALPRIEIDVPRDIEGEVERRLFERLAPTTRRVVTNRIVI